MPTTTNLLTYVNLATALHFTLMLSWRNSCLISSIHCAIYLAYKQKFKHSHLFSLHSIISFFRLLYANSLLIINDIWSGLHLINEFWWINVMLSTDVTDTTHNHIQLIKTFHTSNVTSPRLSKTKSIRFILNFPNVDWFSITSLSLLFRMPRTKSVRFLSNIRSKLPLTFLRAIFHHYSMLSIHQFNIYKQLQPFRSIFIETNFTNSQFIHNVSIVKCTFNHKSMLKTEG